MANLSHWEPLAAALQRVVAAGAPEDQVKLDLCRAISERQIAVRIHIEVNQTRRMVIDGDFARTYETTLSGDKVPVPSQLAPEDIDWKQSRPLKQWPIGPQPGMSPTHAYILNLFGLFDRAISYVEVCRADVTQVLCERDCSIKIQPAVDRNMGLGAKANGVTEAINQLWPNGIPKGLSAKDRDRQIVERLDKNGCSVPKNPARAIQRVLKARKPG